MLRLPFRDRLSKCAVVVIIACVAAVGAGSSNAATSSTVVGASVPSATYLATTNCDPDTTGSTELGLVTPGSSVVSNVDCSVTFGSSNDTSRLRLTQQDGIGAAMYRIGSDAFDPTWPGAGRNVVDFTPAMIDRLDKVHVLEDDSVLLACIVDNGGASFYVVAKYDASGSLVAGFGAGGLATLAVPGTGTVGSVTTRPDGSIVVIGSSDSGTSQLTITQFDAGGIPDGLFGTGGVASFQVGNAAAAYDESWVGGEVLPDGSIIAGGIARMSGARWDYVAAKVLADGSGLDTVGYGGGDGIAQATGDTVGVNGYSATVEPDGAVLVSGASYRSGNLDGNVARFTPAGIADPAFGLAADGVLVVRWDGAQYDHATRTIVDPSGGWYVLGMSLESGTTWRLALARVLPAGTLDPSFGTGGRIVDTTYATGLQATDLLWSGNDKLQVVGSRFAPNGTFAARFNLDGTLDTAYGTSGVLVLSTTDAAAASADWQSDGRLVIAGRRDGNDSVNYRLGTTPIAQYDPGTTDWASPSTTSTFGACIANATNATVSAPWLEDGDGSCSPLVADPWQPIAASSVSSTASIATAADGVVNANVALRFGMKTANALVPGRYVAPVVLTVVAPSA
jgi:uncharacterized delta-60 repeat protein